MIFSCLHLWIPHEGRSISSLFFLDDHKNLTLELVKINFQIIILKFNHRVIGLNYGVMQYQVVIKIENLKFGVVQIGVVYKLFGI